MNKGRFGKISQRVLAFILSAALVLGGMPLSAKADNLDTNGKVTDPSTLHQWQDWFTDNSTEFAGGVWTDKSVFESVNEFETALGNASMDIQMKDNDSFLVALSALASNKEIVGYSTIPTDTMLILDVSQSMDNSNSVPQMVESANDTIDALLDLNKNNRVGIVLYSGNSENGTSATSTGTLLLELGRYDANRDGNYITYSSDIDNEGKVDTTVRLAAGIRVEGASQNMSTQGKSKNTTGGTYIQNGIDIAMDEFLAVEDTTIESGNVQGGTTRMPIFVLLSDGAPTTGTPNYTNIGQSSAGYGGTTSASLGFMTQLTAAYAKAQVEAHYNEEAKFYTLGLNLSQQDSDGQYVATSVLDPINSLAAIDTYWDTFIENGRVGFYAPGTATGKDGYDDIWVTVNRKMTDTRPYVPADGLTRESQNYVNAYFSASGNDGLASAFVSIVNEIILQSAYYPTLIGNGGNTELDGYITFEDEIGQFMEVKNITGLMLGDNQLFTGAALTEMMGTEKFGDRYTYTELGWELVESVAERIGVTQDVAIEILKQAWADGQLSYNATTGEFSNYIGWYEGANREYVAYWNEDHTEEDRPANAKYITRSYGFYGTASVGAIESLGSDMMHIVVKVRTDIQTQHQDVVFMIPASLIPVITYHVELDTDSYDTAKDITLTVDEEKPLRLLFEVGIRSDINELNITEVLAEENLLTGQHVHEKDGVYYFYTNQWGDGDDTTGIDYTDPTKHLVTETHFHPNEKNERYYYTTDTLVYVNTGTTDAPVYEEYTGTVKPTDTGYYHAIRVFEATGAANDAAKMENVFAPISESTLENYTKQEDGKWYVEAGTIRREVERFQNRTQKTSNNTETLDYYAYHAVEHPGVGSAEYDVWAFLGNNGRLTITPATGIKLTKLVDDTVTDADAVFHFTVELSNGDFSGTRTYRFVDASGTYGTITFTNGVSSNISLKANETVYIIDLPANATYTVEEANDNTLYKVDSVSQNGTELSDIVATGTIVSKELVDIEFTNTARQFGDLIISKTVTVPPSFGANYVIPADKKFDVEVTLGLANGTTVETSAGIKTVQNGKITFQLAHNESVTIENLLEGTTYSVAEVNVPKGFTLTTTALSGTISGAGAEVSLVNDYEPTGNAPTADININVTKTLKDSVGNDVEWNNREYTFYLEKLEGTTWNRVPNASGTANGQDNTFTLKIPQNSLTAIGSYLFRIVEDVNNQEEGIVSDTAVYFVVVVTDKDMDGSLEVDEIRVNGEAVADEKNVNLTFTNTYVVTGELAVPIRIKKKLENSTGVEMLPSGFVFELYEGTTKVGEATSNANGDATIYMSYDSTWFNAQTKNDAGNVVKTYTLKEAKGGTKVRGMAYDGNTYEVKVEIGLNDANTALRLVSMSIGGDDTDPDATFTNTYSLTPATLSISGTKTMRGRGIGDDKYTFNMYKTGSDFDISKGTKVDDTTNTGTAFTLTDSNITTAGVHYYVIEEVKGDIGGVTYDTTKYHVTVVARDNNNGGLAIANADITIVKVGTGVVAGVEFVNEYKAAPASIILHGTKELEGKNLEHNMFEFVLKEDGTEVSRAWSTARGTITFPEITYTEKGTHVYTVSEIDAGKRGYTYDNNSYEVIVEVTDDGEGQLHAAVTKPNGATHFTFKNIYEAEPVTITLNAVKLLENRHLANHEFTFELYEADSEFNYSGEPIETAHNTARGEIAVSHKITEAGTYYFVMKENVSNPKEDIVYDETEYEITVIVFDQGGYLNYRATYSVEGRSVNNLVFSNVFVPQDPVQKDVYAKGNNDISIDGDAVKAGDILTYEIDYTNFTNVTQNDLVITDKIPTGATYVDGSASENGFVSYKGGTLTWKFDNVEAGEVVVVTFDVQVKAGKADIENKAHVVIGDNEYDTNVVTNYTFDKEVDKANAKLDEELLYTIKYKNTENETADVKIVDVLSEGLTYVDGSATDGGVYDEETHTITWLIEDVAALTDGEVSFKAIINENAVEMIDNVASVQVGNNPEISVDTDTVTTVLMDPKLSLEKAQAVNVNTAEVKSGSKAMLSAREGDIVTYYLTIKNEKGAGTAHSVMISDTIPAGLQLQYKDGVAVISDGGEVNSDGLIVWKIDKLNAGESVTVSFNVVIPKVEKDTTWKNVAYAFYINPDESEPKEPVESNEVEIETRLPAPKMGDNSGMTMWTSLAFGSLMVCAVLIISQRKKEEE